MNAFDGRTHYAQAARFYNRHMVRLMRLGQPAEAQRCKSFRALCMADARRYAGARS